MLEKLAIPKWIPDCPIHASSFRSAIPVPFPVPPPATATPGIGAMPRPATARLVTQLGEAAVANASDGQSGILSPNRRKCQQNQNSNIRIDIPALIELWREE